jgi:Fe-S cluster assembly ATP-binding protein
MGAGALLEVVGLRVRAGETEVLRGIDLEIGEGETHVLLGPNGGGKTTLLNAILGLPGYTVTSGSIRLRGTDLLPLTTDERARLGIGVAFQRPPAVRGVKLGELMRVASAAAGALGDEDLADLAEQVDVERMLERDVNLGFSGGEAKRSEMAQLLAQRPALALIDEPESGVDLENIAVVGAAIARLLKGERATDPKRGGLIITHTGHILDYVNADVGHVLFDGRLACQGNPRDLVAEIGSQGFEKCVECALCRQ